MRPIHLARVSPISPSRCRWDTSTTDQSPLGISKFKPPRLPGRNTNRTEPNEPNNPPRAPKLEQRFNTGQGLRGSILSLTNSLVRFHLARTVDPAPLLPQNIQGP